jgi:hypothetical protein
MHAVLLKYLLAFTIACLFSQRGLIADTISLKKDLEIYASRGLGVASVWGHDITEIRLDTMTSSKRAILDLNCRGRTVFSPDGERIGAVCDLPEARYPGGPDEALIVMDSAGRELRRIEGRFRSYALALAPDNRKAAFQSGHGLSVVSFTDGAVHEIVEANWENSETWYPSTTAWSPDSRWIVYELLGKLFIADVVTGNAQYLAEGKAPTWAPSGEWIAYCTRSNEPRLINPKGGAAKSVPGIERVNREMKWSPDSKFLLYTDRHRSFVSDVLSIGSPGGLDSRVLIYRLSDGKKVVVTSILPVGITESYGWIVHSTGRR